MTLRKYPVRPMYPQILLDTLTIYLNQYCWYEKAVDSQAFFSLFVETNLSHAAGEQRSYVLLPPSSLSSDLHLHLEGQYRDTVTMTTGGCCHLPGSLCDCASSPGLWKSVEESGGDGCQALYVTQVTALDGRLLSSVLKPLASQR